MSDGTYAMNFATVRSSKNYHVRTERTKITMEVEAA